jgi:hypothetical protein
LAENPYVKESLNVYLDPNYAWNQSKLRLFRYCDNTGRLPVESTKFENKKIGIWLQCQKQKIKDTNSERYIKLSINPLVKKSIDDCLSKRIK